MNEYIQNYTKGLSEIITSDPIVTSLFIGSIAVAKDKGVAAGVATFFLGYAAMGEATNMAMTLGHASKQLSGALVARQGSTLSQSPPFVPSPPNT
jgi:hypothetical protein